MTLRGLIEAVERGEYHSSDKNIPCYSFLLTDLDQAGVKYSRLGVVEAMHKGSEATAAILRALEGEP